MQSNIDNLADLRKRKMELRQEMKVTESLLWEQAGCIRKQSEHYLLHRLAIPLAGKVLVNTAMNLISGSTPLATSETAPQEGPASEVNHEGADWQQQLIDLGVSLLQNWQTSRAAAR
jgi:hypothetical protein